MAVEFSVRAENGGAIPRTVENKAELVRSRGLLACKVEFAVRTLSLCRNRQQGQAWVTRSIPRKLAWASLTMHKDNLLAELKR